MQDDDIIAHRRLMNPQKSDRSAPHCKEILVMDFTQDGTLRFPSAQ